jgi:hypothetical protein
MKLIHLKMVVAVFIFMSIASSPSFAQVKSPKPQPLPFHTDAVVLKCEMRSLWEDHTIWTRNLILCLVDDLPGKNQAVLRLQKNQDDIGNAFAPYYGDAVCEKLTILLRTHIDITIEVLNATKVGNVLALDEANKRWYANADKISETLNKQNSYWPLADLITMMNEHLKLTNDVTVQRVKKDYDADIIASDKIRTKSLMMADMFTNGLIRQFPARFREAKKAKK